MQAIQMFALAAAIVAVVLQTTDSSTQSPASGPENMTYLVPFLGRNNDAVDANDVSYTLAVTNTGESNIDVSVYGIGDGNTEEIYEVPGFKDIAAGSSVRKTFENDSLALNNSQTRNTTLRISSEDGPFQLQVYITVNGYTEGFLGVPLEKMQGPNVPNDVHEFVAATFCDTGGYCQIAVAANEDDTAIYLKVPDHVENIVLCRDNTFYRTKEITKITMKKFEVIQLESTYDMSGTHIYSKKPLAVFAGSRNVTNGDVVAHTVEQLVPSSHWGTEFAVKNLGTTGYGDILKIVSGWGSTKVTMRGYPSFTITNQLQTIVRRLDQDKFDMDNGYGTPTELKVGGTNINSSYSTIVDYTALRVATVDSTVSQSYAVELDNRTSNNIIDSKPNGLGVTGIVQCNQTATMPLSSLLRQEPDDPVPPNTCREGFKGTSTFNPDSGLIQTHILDLSSNQFNGDVLRLRTQLCGDGSLLFRSSTTKLILKVNHASILMTKYNDNAIDGCEGDMLFFWFKEIRTENDGLEGFCFGAGVKADQDCSAGSTSIRKIDLDVPFTTLEMSGLTREAIFNYEFVNPAGCMMYESANRVADSFGREFLLVVPIGTNYCRIYVTPLAQNTHIAVGSGTSVIPGTTYNRQIRMYDCLEYVSEYKVKLIHVLSDADVAVNVYIKHPHTTNKYPIMNIPVQPLDSFGMELMMLDRGDGENHKRYCFPVSAFDDAKMIWFTKDSKDKVFYTGNARWPPSGRTVSFGDLMKGTSGEDFTGTYFKFTRPSSIFCGQFSSAKENYIFYQVPALMTWSTHYTIPSFGDSTANRPFDAKLKIVTNSDNTIVNITGGFDALHVLYDRGDFVEQDIDLSSHYHIASNEAIGVSILFYNPTVPTDASFHLLPAPHNFMSGFLAVAPTGILGDEMNFDTGSVYSFFSSGQQHNTTTTGDSTSIKNNFYFNWLNEGPSFGFTVVMTDSNSWFIVPSYTVHGPDAKWFETDSCQTSVGTVGDGIDNDCDGLADEDTCYTGYGVYREGLSIVNTTVWPVCLQRPDRPPEECWTLCSCPCSWAEKYEREKNLTMDELEEAYEEKNKQLESDLKVETDELSSVSAEKESASDERQSAASIGYLGIAMFVLVFGTIFILDLSALARDAIILFGNLNAGFTRVLLFRKKFAQTQIYCKSNYREVQHRFGNCTNVTSSNANISSK
ncbi:FCGBP-like protein [Mya arenaria]|uniref:FCGBP-like protein n=1 Tax=Mya arenaria TaxID=6604 RepID=A0ABY7DNT0_MYAAR|nr:FCGBP-like protein [Mya arenaria]